MDKRKKDNNIVPFPNLQHRLLDKGMDALQQKKFDEALHLLNEAIEIDERMDEVHFAIVVCLFELGYLEEAKEKCENMLKQDIGDYFDVLQVYLTILVQLRKYEEVESTIEVVLQEGKVPPQTAENLYKLLEFSRKMIKMEEDKEDPLFEIDLLLEDISIQEQWNMITTLKNLNQSISFSYRILEQFLEDEMKHPLLKTAILQLFIDRGIERTLVVEKFGQRLSIHTTQLHDIPSHPFTRQVLDMLDHVLGNENPSLFEVVKEMWDRHLYVMYPFIPEPKRENLWAAGLHKVGNDLHGIEVDYEEIAELYEIDRKEVQFACSRVKEIEEISYIQETF